MSTPTSAEAKQIVCSASGEDAVSNSPSKKWFQSFKRRNLDIEDEERPGQPEKVKDENSRNF